MWTSVLAILVGPRMETKKHKNTNKPGSSSSEDELLASSQETIVEANNTVLRSASHSTPTPVIARSTSHSTPLTKPGCTASTSHSTTMHPSNTSTKPGTSKKYRSAAVSLKREYSKAKYILSKIAKNEAEGKTHERDATDKVKFSKIVQEFETQPAQSVERAAKRNRSQDEAGADARKAKVARTGTIDKAKMTAKKFSDIVKCHLNVAVIDEKAPNKRVSAKLWVKIEAALSEIVMNHILESAGGPLPCFDSSEVVRGYRVVKCEDRFSLDFLSSSVAKICNTWDEAKIGIIPAGEIPRRPRARIWLPRMDLEGEKLIKCLKLHNPDVPMDNWVVIKKEEDTTDQQKSSSSFLLLINEESLVPLEKLEHKLRFGIRHAKVKIFQANSGELDELDATSDLLEEMSLETDPEAKNSKGDEDCPD